MQAKVSAEAEGCSVDIEGDIIVDANTNDNNPPSSISCEVNTTGISTGFAQDVVANATASVSVFACKNTTEIVANITSQVSPPCSSTRYALQWSSGHAFHRVFNRVNFGLNLGTCLACPLAQGICVLLHTFQSIVSAFLWCMVGQCP